MRCGREVLTRKDKLVPARHGHRLPVGGQQLDGFAGALREEREQVVIEALHVVHLTFALVLCA